MCQRGSNYDVVEFADGSCLQGLVFCGDGSQSGVRSIPCDSMESSSIMNFTASLNADTREALAACHDKKWNPRYSRYLSPLVYKAICIKQKESCHHSLGSLELMQLELGIFPLTALGDRGEHDQWVETMMKYATASGSYLDKEASKNFVGRYRSYEHVAWDVGTEVAVDSLEEKTVVHIDFAVGDIVEKVTRTPNKKVSRPVTRSFCAQLVANVQAATVEKNKKQRAIVGDGALEVKPRAATVPKLGEGGFGSVYKVIMRSYISLVWLCQKHLTSPTQ
ncbi:hypothetical protein POM88_012226 [Heracleum sosnowskyi]|uniref:Uncharacterized protein n=1 Tax=Heracleum sosnowskyi TaxID=360622 RepID=A0AAD8IWC0_9APIA|nr:hypothetical protein POM88_012226 [Heracleum sosnowskyi]